MADNGPWELWELNDGPWEHQNDPLLRKHRKPLRQFFILMGIAAVLAVGLMVLMSLNPPAGTP